MQINLMICGNVEGIRGFFFGGGGSGEGGVQEPKWSRSKGVAQCMFGSCPFILI